MQQAVTGISLGKIMSGVAEATLLLVKNQPLESTIAETVRLMGSAVQADRCYVFQNTMVNQQLCMRQLAEWTAEGISVQLNNPELQEVPYNIHPQLEATLSKGKPLTGSVLNSPEPFRSIMQEQQILSFLFLPIQVKGSLWGFIGYDSCKADRFWQEYESDALQTLANGLGFFLENLELRAALVNSNRRFNLAISGSKDGIWELDLATGKSFLSDLWLDIFGYSDQPTAWTYQSWLEKVHPEDRERVDQEYTVYLESRQGTIDLNYRYMHGLGHYVWVHSRAAAEWDEAGNPLRMAGSDADITESTMQSQVLAENERQYRNLVNNLQEVVFESDAAGKFTFLNKSWETLTGYSVEESLGQGGAKFLHPTELTKVNGWRQAIDAHPQHFIIVEVCYQHKKGYPVWAEITAKRVFHADGTLLGTAGTIIDLTARREAEKRLQESEAKFRLISENITDIITQHDLSGRLTFASPSMQEVLGYAPETLLGQNPIGYIHPADQSRVANDAFQSLLRGKEGVSVSYRIRHLNGRYIWMESNTRLLRTPNSESVAIQASTRDITARKKAELEVARALEKEKELMELRSRFVMMASHEFRTPLATIRSSLDLMEMYLASAPSSLRGKTDKHFEKIKLEIDRVSELMNEILLLGKLEAGNTRLQLQPYHLHALVADIIQQHYNPAITDRIPTLSVSGTPFPVEIDGQLISHCLTNLLSNALKFSAGKRNPEVQVIYGRNKVTLSVTDFGMGIAAKDKRRIFEPFYRGSNTEKIPGSGLGLVVVKEFVHLHQGKVFCKSTPGKSTTFTIELKA